MVFFASGCYKPTDERVNIQEGIRSDTLESNTLTRPVFHAFSALGGAGIEIKNVDVRTSELGFMQLQVTGYNNSYDTRTFRYKVEWLDRDGHVLDAKTSVWMPVSALSKATFTIQSTAPSKDAVNFRMNTRK
jgi:uncharacterized protein YcfL